MPTTQRPVTITPVGLTDLQAAAPLFDAYRQFYGYPGNLPEVRDFLFDRLSKLEALVFLAWDASRTPSQAVGFMLMYPSFSSLALSPILYLNDLFVLPEYRRQGVGLQLLNYAKDLAREFGYTRISLETAQTNDAARQLYESVGYVRETQLDRYHLAVD